MLTSNTSFTPNNGNFSLCDCYYVQDVKTYKMELICNRTILSKLEWSNFEHFSGSSQNDNFDDASLSSLSSMTSGSPSTITNYTNDDTYHILASSICIILCFIGVLTNIFVIYVLQNYSSKKKPANNYLLHNSISDLLYVLAGINFSLQGLLDYWPYQPKYTYENQLQNETNKSNTNFFNFSCELTIFIDILSHLATVCLTIQLTVDRLLLIKYEKYRIKNFKKCINLIWTFCIIYALIHVITSNVMEKIIENEFHKDHDEVTELNELCEYKYYCTDYVMFKFGYFLTRISVFFIAPIIIFGICYFKIVQQIKIVAKRRSMMSQIKCGSDSGPVPVVDAEDRDVTTSSSRQSENLHTNSSSERERPLLKKQTSTTSASTTQDPNIDRSAETKVKIKCSIIIAIYILSWLPFYLNGLINYFRPINEHNKSISNVEEAIIMATLLPVYLNATLNPILYVFVSDDFQKGYKRALRMQTAGPISIFLGIFRNCWAEGTIDYNAIRKSATHTHGEGSSVFGSFRTTADSFLSSFMSSMRSNFSSKRSGRGASEKPAVDSSVV